MPEGGVWAPCLWPVASTAWTRLPVWWVSWVQRTGLDCLAPLVPPGTVRRDLVLDVRHLILPVDVLGGATYKWDKMLGTGEESAGGQRAEDQARYNALGFEIQFKSTSSSVSLFLSKICLMSPILSSWLGGNEFSPQTFLFYLCIFYWWLSF